MGKIESIGWAWLIIVTFPFWIFILFGLVDIMLGCFDRMEKEKGQMKKYLLVANEAELKLPASQKAIKEGREIIVTGVGGTNVIRACLALPKKADILNVGFCGSAYLPIGGEYNVGCSRLWHPNVTFREEVTLLDCGTEALNCYTAGDFVELGPGTIPPGGVFDMELAYIAAFGFAKLKSIKYVSDNLNFEQYEDTINKQ